MIAVPTDDLFPEARNPQGTLAINDRCVLRTQDGNCVLFVSGIILAQYAVTDRMAQAHAMVSLVEQGWADQIEVARAFHCTVRTVRRQQRRFEESGLAGLGQDRGYPRGRSRLAPSRRQLVHQLKAQGCGQREIARRIGVSENAVRELLRRLGWKSTSPAQSELPMGVEKSARPKLSGFATASASPPLSIIGQGADPNLSAFGAAANTSPGISQDTDPGDRRADRLLACLGLLEDAPPLFGSARALPRAGVLLALPVLVFPLFLGQEPPREEIDAYIRHLDDLRKGGARISLVQVYSATRPMAHPDCGHLRLKTLSQISQRIKVETGLRAEVF